MFRDFCQYLHDQDEGPKERIADIGKWWTTHSSGQKKKKACVHGKRRPWSKYPSVFESKDFTYYFDDDDDS